MNGDRTWPEQTLADTGKGTEALRDCHLPSISRLGAGIARISIHFCLDPKPVCLTMMRDFFQECHGWSYFY